MIFIGLVVWCGILGCIPGAIASSKGREFMGWWVYGFLIFPIALIHSLTLGSVTMEARAISAGDVRKCPHCAELIKCEAIVCRFCGRESPAAAAINPYEHLPSYQRGAKSVGL